MNIINTEFYATIVSDDDKKVYETAHYQDKELLLDVIKESIALGAFANYGEYPKVDIYQRRIEERRVNSYDLVDLA